MPNLALAELVLSLLTPKDAAACIAGDLAEEAASGSRRGFWRPVLGTALALFWQPAKRRPARAFLFTLAGLLFTQLALSGLITGALLGSMPFTWAFTNFILAPLVIGLTLARCSRGSEITSCGLLALAAGGAAGLSLTLAGFDYAIAIHFLQGNLIAAGLFVLCGVFTRVGRPVTSF